MKSFESDSASHGQPGRNLRRFEPKILFVIFADVARATESLG